MAHVERQVARWKEMHHKAIKELEYLQSGKGVAKNPARPI
jgi:hypothetical protein